MVTLPEAQMDDMSETGHIENDALINYRYLTIKHLAILRCLNATDMVLLGLVIERWEVPASDTCTSTKMVTI